MIAEIMAVGTELLLGDIVNTNAQYLSRELANLGIEVYYQTVVGDNPNRLENAIKNAFERADMVITTGGLGPTEDDLTKETGAAYFGLKLVQDAKALELLEQNFKKLKRVMTPNNIKQSFVPEGAKVLYNRNGTAPGILIEKNGKIMVMLPGPPKETIPMFEEQVKPYLAEKQEYMFVSRVLRVAAVGESAMETAVKELIDTQKNPTIAPYAKQHESILRITAKAHSQEEAEKLIEPVAEKIYQILGENVYAEGETSMQEVVAKLLLEKGYTISVSESCTGGLLSSSLVEYPGISQVFMQGVVSYSNEAKMSRLGVKAQTLEKYGAVSSQTAAEMAEGVAKSAGTDIGISTTGVAGPGGGTKEKPVGLVYLGLYFQGQVKTKELRLWGDRQRIRERAVVSALDWLRRELIEKH